MVVKKHLGYIFSCTRIVSWCVCQFPLEDNIATVLPTVPLLYYSGESTYIELLQKPLWSCLEVGTVGFFAPFHFLYISLTSHLQFVQFFSCFLWKYISFVIELTGKMYFHWLSWLWNHRFIGFEGFYLIHVYTAEIRNWDLP